MVQFNHLGKKICVSGSMVPLLKAYEYLEIPYSGSYLHTYLSAVMHSLYIIIQLGLVGGYQST